MDLAKLKTDQDGYLIDPDTGERVTFWECDPAKNFLCAKESCRHCMAEGEDGIGFCASTPESAFAKDGAKPFYKRLNGDGYFGREYIKEAEA